VRDLYCRSRLSQNDDFDSVASSIREYHGGRFDRRFDFRFRFRFDQISQSTSQAALGILIIFVSVSPRLTSACLRTFKYTSNELLCGARKMVRCFIAFRGQYPLDAISVVASLCAHHQRRRAPLFHLIGTF
jgi:hypothetical protein